MRHSTLAVNRLVLLLGLTVLMAFQPAAEAAAPRNFNEITKGLSPDQITLLNGYREKYDRIKEVYSQLEIDARATKIIGKKTNPTKTEVAHVKSLSHGSTYSRVDREVVSTSGKRARIGGAEVTMVNPDGFFTASRHSSETDFLVERVGRDLEEGQSHTRSFLFPHASYSIYGAPLELFIFQSPPGFNDYQIDDVAVRDETNEVTVKASAVGPTGIPVAFKFVFDAGSWVLKEYAMGHRNLREKHAEVIRGRMIYSDREESGVPLLERVANWYEVGPQKEIYSLVSYDIQSIDPFEGSLDQFTGESIGIDVAFPMQRSHRLLFICLALGLFFLAAYSALKWSKRTA